MLFFGRQTTFFILGIVSGMPLALTSSTLSMRLIDIGIDKATLGVFGLIGIVYSIKFLYAPLFDYFKIPIVSKLFGKRLSWLILAVGLGTFGILLMSQAGDKNDITLIALSTLLIAFASTIFDISVDAFRIESVEKSLLGFTSSVFIYGYRVGMLIAGGFAIFLADKLDWAITYVLVALIYAGCFSLSLFLALCFKMIKREHKKVDKDKSLLHQCILIFVDPFLDVLKRPYAKTFLLMVAMFKITDAYVGSMLNPFYVELGFSKTEIAQIIKGFGFIATLVGLGIGGYLTSKMSMAKMLIFSLCLQIASNQIWIVQNYLGHDTMFLAVAISVENISSSISSVALVHIISRACNVQYSGTQYAVMSSFASLSRTVLSSTNGLVASKLGWNLFFISSGLLEIPCVLIALFLLRKKAIK